MRRALGNLILAAAAVVATLFLLELGIRVVGLPPHFGRLISLYGVPTREVDGVVLWKPDDRERRFDAQTIEHAARNDVFAILGLGDSIMFGVGVPAEQGYLGLTQTALRERARQPLQILNMAIPGYNTAQENAVHKEYSARVRPELVIVHYWADDGRQYRVFGEHVVDFGDMLDDGGLVQALPLPRPVNDFLLIHSKLYALFTHIAVVNNYEAQPTDFGRVVAPLTEIAARTARDGGRLLVLASPDLADEPPRSNPDLYALRKLGAEHGFEVIDLVDWLGGATTAQIAMDTVHFNAEGHRILAEALVEYLLAAPLLRPAGEPSPRPGPPPVNREP